MLLDNNLPSKLRALMIGHDVFSARYLGWSDLPDGDLLREAQQAGFDVMLTADKNIWHQQNHDKRMISLVVLSTNDWLVVKRSVPVILAALDRLRPGSFEEVLLSS